MIFDIKNFRNIPLRSQSEIMASWDASPVVSIICLSYNHEQYIEDAIRGFLIQETNFPFEIIIHDDASSDGTVNIIKKYQKEYSILIKSIFQIENQYSKLPNSVLSICFAQASGEYYALCEGDDFWISPHKLKNQRKAIESNPSLSLVTHNALSMNRVGELSNFREINSDHSFDFSGIMKVYGQFAPTASYFFKKNVIEALPVWFDGAPVGDLLIELYSQKEGVGLFLKEKSSIYRVGAINSWTNASTATKNDRARTFSRLIAMYRNLYNDFPDYESIINSRVIYCYGVVAYQVCGYNIFLSFSRANSKAYKKIRDEAKVLQVLQGRNDFFLLPPNLFLFTIFFVFRSIKKDWRYLSKTIR